MSTHYKYDIFLSHAVEDKKGIADLLNDSLKERNIRVWYSGEMLGIGSSLMEEINNGLVASRYGILILSPTYFKKKWTLSECYGLFALETAAQKRILPIWHNVDEQAVLAKFPILADRFALSSSKGLDFLVDRIAKVVHGTSADLLEEQRVAIGANRKTELQQLVALGKFKEVFDKVFTFLDQSNDAYTQLILLSAELHDLQRRERMGTLAERTIDQKKNRIRFCLNELIMEQF